jgi:hypothetical protein
MIFLQISNTFSVGERVRRSPKFPPEGRGWYFESKMIGMLVPLFGFFLRLVYYRT